MDAEETREKGKKEASSASKEDTLVGLKDYVTEHHSFLPGIFSTSTFNIRALTLWGSGRR